LGFVVYTGHRRLKRRKKVQFERWWRILVSSFLQGETSEERLQATWEGWVNHVRYGSTAGLRRAILERSPQEVVGMLISSTSQ